MCFDAPPQPAQLGMSLRPPRRLLRLRLLVQRSRLRPCRPQDRPAGPRDLSIRCKVRQVVRMAPRLSSSTSLDVFDSTNSTSPTLAHSTTCRLSHLATQVDASRHRPRPYSPRCLECLDMAHITPSPLQVTQLVRLDSVRHCPSRPRVS
jgi:hypothetical protein